MVRGLPMEPRAPLRERLRALPFFLNNLFPAIRAGWIRWSRRVTVTRYMMTDRVEIAPDSNIGALAHSQSNPIAVVVDRRRVLLGAVENGAKLQLAVDAMNPAPQTIRPDMTTRLAATLMKASPYLLITTAEGRYMGRYRPPQPRPA
ncbi:MAG: hypothetical protein ACREQX_12310 [Candidatus Binataceae bacterium]